MLRTILILIFTLIIVPIICFNFTEGLSDKQYDILFNSGKILIAVIVLTFVTGEITNNNSQVDKLWSIVPIIYAWFIAFSFDYPPRLILMAILVTIWGIRLTYNFARRGGYSWKFWSGEEDYRWEILRKRPPFNGKRLPWTFFNLFFITGYQNILIFLFTLPILAASADGNSSIIIWDYILALAFIFFVIYETIADQQQWNYQKEKYRLINSGEILPEKYKKGFTHTGLWGISRHPNYFAEQSIWVIFYFFTVISTGEWINWSIMGCLLLLILFKSSSEFSEEISASKYPEYSLYQKSIPRFFPKLWGTTSIEPDELALKTEEVKSKD